MMPSTYQCLHTIVIIATYWPLRYKLSHFSRIQGIVINQYFCYYYCYSYFLLLLSSFSLFLFLLSLLLSRLISIRHLKDALVIIVNMSKPRKIALPHRNVYLRIIILKAHQYCKMQCQKQWSKLCNEWLIINKWLFHNSLGEEVKGESRFVFQTDPGYHPAHR